MSYLFLSILAVSVTSWAYVKYTQNNASLLLMRLLGYTSIYYDKVAEYFASNDVHIQQVTVDKASSDVQSPCQVKDFEHLEIRYSQVNRTYRVHFYNNEEVVFPVYQKGELDTKKAFCDSSENIIFLTIRDSHTQEELSVTEDQVRILKEFSGPKGNFYEDKIPHYSEKIKPQLLEALDLPDSVSLHILYSNGDSRTIWKKFWYPSVASIKQEPFKSI